MMTVPVIITVPTLSAATSAPATVAINWRKMARLVLVNKHDANFSLNTTCIYGQRTCTASLIPILHDFYHHMGILPFKLTGFNFLQCV